MKTCIDCQKEIGPYAERCRSCAATFRNLNGGGNFKDGHTLVQKTCECGNPIRWDSMCCIECRDKISIKRLAQIERPKLALLQTHKLCPKCHKDLPVSEFYIHPNGHYQAYCKQCNTIVHLEQRNKNLEKYNKRETEWRHRTGRSKFFGQGKRPKLNRPIKLDGKIYSPTWNEIKKVIYQRDNWTCQECGVHCSKKGQIQCHHIDYNTGNNLSINLITLCRNCHGMTNIDREFFQRYFENKLLLSIKNDISHWEGTL